MVDPILRRRVLVRTNPLGARTKWRVGLVFEDDLGQHWRIVKHKVVPTTPDATVLVYATRCRPND